MADDEREGHPAWEVAERPAPATVRARQDEGADTMLTAMLYDLWTAIRRAQLRRRAIAELSALDDRLLRDIGISRGEIRTAADGTPRAPAPARDRGARPMAPSRAPCAPAAACR
jgi:uncharacterized protein YjiS (DUF1127 family)